jgi:hypothetical protein
MDIRKIAVVGSFAAGAALALAPLASAAPVEITSTVDSEIASLNSLFTSDVALSGEPITNIIPPTATNPFDTIPLADAPQGTPNVLDYLLYGVDPVKAGISGDPGSYDVLNGALGKFDDAYNVALYALENNGAIDPNAADFIGSASSIAHGLGETSATNAFDYFWNFGVGDLSGFFQTPLTFLDIPGTF